MLGEWPVTLEAAAIYYGRWRRRGQPSVHRYAGNSLGGYPYPYGRHDLNAVQDRRGVQIACRLMTGPWIWPGHDMPLAGIMTRLLLSLEARGVMAVPTRTDPAVVREMYDLALITYVRTTEGRRTMTMSRYGRDRLHAWRNA